MSSQRGESGKKLGSCCGGPLTKPKSCCAGVSRLRQPSSSRLPQPSTSQSRLPNTSRLPQPTVQYPLPSTSHLTVLPLPRSQVPVPRSSGPTPSTSRPPGQYARPSGPTSSTSRPLGQYARPGGPTSSTSRPLGQYARPSGPAPSAPLGQYARPSGPAPSTSRPLGQGAYRSTASAGSVAGGSNIPRGKTVVTRTTIDPDGRKYKVTTITETVQPLSTSRPATGPPSKLVPRGRAVGGQQQSSATRLPTRAASNTKVNASKQRKPCGCRRKGEEPTSGPEPIPDIPADTAGAGLDQESSLERLVSEELREKSFRSPGQSAHAQQSRTKPIPIPVVMTPEGPIRATHQMTLQQTVERTSDGEFIKKHMTAIEANACGSAEQYELNVQDIQPGEQEMQDELAVEERISTCTSLTTGADITVQTHSAVYETVKPLEVQYSATEISQMVDEEIIDVDKIGHLEPPELKGSASADYPLKKKLQKMKFTPESVKRLQSSIIYPPVSASEAQEETQPEVLAAIMHTEEQGLNMDSVPTNVYNYLFPDVKDDLLIQINPVAPGVLQNVVVPTTVPSDLHVHGVTPELEFTAVEAIECGRRRPPDNLYSKTVLMGAAPSINNTALRGKDKERVGSKKPYLVLTSEEPPWEIEDIQPIINLVGAVPLKTLTTEDAFEVPAFYHELENVLEYHLIPEPPQHVSKVQLRGSQQPPWFPGYYMALPDHIKVVKSPCEVLPAAWQAVQPDIFSDDSFLIVDH